MMKAKTVASCIALSALAYLALGFHHALAVPLCDDTSVGPQEYCLESEPCPGYQECPCVLPPATLDDCGTCEAVQEGDRERWNCDGTGTDTLCDWVGPVKHCFSMYLCYQTEQGQCVKGVTVCLRVETETTENVSCSPGTSY